MKEVNEAYSILIKHKGSYQSGSYGSGGGYGSGGSYGSNGSYGSSGGYGSYGGYGQSGGGYSGYGGQRQSGGYGGGFDFGGFDFGDFFGGGQQRNYQTSSYTENDPELKNASSAVLSGRYSDAISLLPGRAEPQGRMVLLERQGQSGAGQPGSGAGSRPEGRADGPRTSPPSGSCWPS